MKKLLALLMVFCFVSVASATLVSFQELAVGTLGTAENPASASDLITIKVTQSGGLLGLDLVASVSGGTIVDAFKPADAAVYGWDAGLCAAPVISGATAEICAANFAGNNSALVGYFVVRVDGTDNVVLSLSPGMSFGGSSDLGFGAPEVSGTSLTIMVPEPATMVILGLGGLLLRRKK